jgi:addiction module RelE/StbE family toxin
MATVNLSNQAKKAYERIARSDPRLLARIDRTLDDLAENPALGKPLHGPFADMRSLRVGPLRIVYSWEADRLLVFVVNIGQRGEVYRVRG